MFQSLYDFFYSQFVGTSGFSQTFLQTGTMSLFGVNTGVRQYLAFMSTLVSYVIILVLCCLFVAKIIKLIGNLVK